MPGVWEEPVPAGVGQVIPAFGLFICVKASSTLRGDEDVHVRGKQGQIQVVVASAASGST